MDIFRAILVDAEGNEWMFGPYDSERTAKTVCTSKKNGLGVMKASGEPDFVDGWVEGSPLNWERI